MAGKQTWVMDVSDPANMQVVFRNDSGSPISDWVARSNDLGVAYVAGPGIRAIDMATGATLGSIQPAGQELDVTFWGTTVYSGQYTEGFAVLDFSDPTAPTQIGGFTDHYVRSVAAYHDVLYAAGDQLLEAFDVSDPTSPVLKFSTPVYRSGALAVEGVRLFQSRGSDGAFLYDIRDPSTPVLVGSCSRPG